MIVVHKLSRLTNTSAHCRDLGQLIFFLFALSAVSNAAVMRVVTQRYSAILRGLALRDDSHCSG